MNEENREKELYRRVTGKSNKHGIAVIPCMGETMLKNILYEAYPYASHVTIINLNDRDSENIPHITTKKLRGINLSTTYERSGRSFFFKSASAQWTDLYAVLENQQAIVKKVRVNTEWSNQ